MVNPALKKEAQLYSLGTLALLFCDLKQMVVCRTDPYFLDIY
jgi:hypothetical protein